ncbi:hypothetical protein [Pedobacter glucosidilyticus]|uniref:hypothetical protein n=1 Tax=Pedobacter glucosidilyticus TaxID=1122941 RepID=UPI00041CB1A1|nr:hypothetical protein [Pedobacter glucosidilyticus]
MKQIKKILMICLLISGGSLMAQQIQLGEFKPKDTSFGLGKLKGKAKKVYIAAFNVNYQVYNEKQDFKQGGSTLGGGFKGDALAEISVGLDGLTNQDVQKITDKLYADYVAQLKSKGLTIVTADEAAKTSVYADFEKLKGGEISLAQLPGTLSSAPSGYEYFVKKVDKSGKVKSGGFLGTTATLYPKLSSELDDAIIAEVNMYVLFIESANAFKGNGANIKVQTNLRISGPEAIEMTSDNKVKFKGQNEYFMASSGVNFYHGKMGMGATTTYSGSLSKSLEINGVIEDTKLQSFANRSYGTANQTVYGTFFTAQNKSAKNSKVVEVDGAKYYEGVYMAAKKFMDHHTQEFLKGF